MTPRVHLDPSCQVHVLDAILHHSLRRDESLGFGDSLWNAQKLFERSNAPSELAVRRTVPFVLIGRGNSRYRL